LPPSEVEVVGKLAVLTNGSTYWFRYICSTSAVPLVFQAAKCPR
jgi:hypothetical protein